MKNKQFVHPPSGRHYHKARLDFIQNARQNLDDFIIDELGEDYYQQLRYEAACTALKDIKKEMDAMVDGKAKRQIHSFYLEKLELLEGKASEFDSTPYTL